MNIFIGGSKNIGRLSPKVSKILHSIMKRHHRILIGDCYGADLAVQHFLAEHNYANVAIYTACKTPRHNVGCWKEIMIETEEIGFSAHREKDTAMVKNCDFGIMIWDGKSKGTLANIEELRESGKKVVIINETRGKSMDFFKFINSKAIREHLQKINYKFRSAEAAWLVYRSKYTTFNERYQAFKYIINQMPDDKLPDRATADLHCSLHEFLKGYTALLDQAVDWVKNDNDGVYTYSIYEVDFGWDHDNPIYSNYESCLAACKEKVETFCHEAYSIKKQSFDTPNKIVTVHYNKDHVMTDIHTLGYDNDYFCDILSYYCFYFPTPFQKGDILCEYDEFGNETGPFVMMGNSAMDKKYTGSADVEMNAWGYFMDDKNGMIYFDMTPNYMDLDYYPDIVNGRKRVLKVLSFYLKDEIDIDLLLNAYLYIIVGEYLHSFNPTDQTKRTLEKVGFFPKSQKAE